MQFIVDVSIKVQGSEYRIVYIPEVVYGERCKCSFAINSERKRTFVMP